MENQNKWYQHLIFFLFLKRQKAVETCKKICAVCGEDEINSDKVKELVNTNPHYTTREITVILQITKSSVENYLHQHGQVSRLDVWVPYPHNEANFVQRISICNSLQRRDENDLCLKRMVTGDKKQLVYYNVQTMMGEVQLITTNNFQCRISPKKSPYI